MVASASVRALMTKSGSRRASAAPAAAGSLRIAATGCPGYLAVQASQRGWRLGVLAANRRGFRATALLWKSHQSLWAARGNEDLKWVCMRTPVSSGCAIPDCGVTTQPEPEWLIFGEVAERTGAKAASCANSAAQATSDKQQIPKNVRFTRFSNPSACKGVCIFPCGLVGAETGTDYQVKVLAWRIPGN